MNITTVCCDSFLIYLGWECVYTQMGLHACKYIRMCKRIQHALPQLEVRMYLTFSLVCFPPLFVSALYVFIHKRTYTYTCKRHMHNYVYVYACIMYGDSVTMTMLSW